MPLDPDRLVALLRDPDTDARALATAIGASPEEVSSASRLVLDPARASPDGVAAVHPALGAAVARALLAAGRADLLALLGANPSRPVAKEAKRALHILKSRGVAVPEPARRAPPPTSGPSGEAEFPCFASAVDGQGERAVWISRAVSGRGIEVGQAVISDVLGLLELQVGLLGRKEFRGLARDMAEKGKGMAVAEIGRERATSLVAAARALNDSSGRRVPEGGDAWLKRLGPPPPPREPRALFPPLPEEEEREALGDSGKLHALPVLRGWLADEDALRALALRLDEIAVSPLYVDERQRSEQAARAVGDALEAWLDGPRRHRLAARLFDTAEHLEALGDPAHARQAAAAARALTTGTPAALVPFARLMVEKALPAAPPAPAAGPPEPGLIVAPR